MGRRRVRSRVGGVGAAVTRQRGAVVAVGAPRLAVVAAVHGDGGGGGCRGGCRGERRRRVVGAAPGRRRAPDGQRRGDVVVVIARPPGARRGGRRWPGPASGVRVGRRLALARARALALVRRRVRVAAAAAAAAAALRRRAVLRPPRFPLVARRHRPLVSPRRRPGRRPVEGGEGGHGFFSSRTKRISGGRVMVLCGGRIRRGGLWGFFFPPSPLQRRKEPPRKKKVPNVGRARRPMGLGAGRLLPGVLSGTRSADRYRDPRRRAGVASRRRGREACDAGGGAAAAGSEARQLQRRR